MKNTLTHVLAWRDNIKMLFTFLVSYLVLDILGCFSNLSTLIYIFKSFEIKTHVFALIFIDSLICSLSSGISIIVDLFLFAGHLQPACVVAFFTIYLPGCYGAVLTFLITTVRFYLAKKAAQNIHPSNKKVMSYAFTFFTLIATCYLSFFIICTLKDVPYSLFADSCINSNQEPRTQSISILSVLHTPFFFNFCSLINDLRMLQFLKKTILPTSSIPMEMNSKIHGGNTELL